MADLGDRAQFFTVDASNTTISLGSNAPSTIDNSIRTIAGALARDFDYRGYKVTSAGTATALTVTYGASDPAALYDGQPITFISHVVAGVGATLKNGALAAKAIKKHTGTFLASLEGTEFGVGQYVGVVYKTTPDCYVLVNPSQPITSATSGGNTCVRLPDGTQICHGAEAVTAVANVATYDTITFALPFSTTTGMTCTTTASFTGPTVTETQYTAATTTTIDIGIVATTAGARTISYHVIGRWY